MRVPIHQQDLPRYHVHHHVQVEILEERQNAESLSAKKCRFMAKVREEMPWRK